MAFLRRIFWLEDDKKFIRHTKSIFQRRGFDIIVPKTFKKAQELIQDESFDAYLVDLDLSNIS